MGRAHFKAHQRFFAMPIVLSYLSQSQEIGRELAQIITLEMVIQIFYHFHLFNDIVG